MVVDSRSRVPECALSSGCLPSRTNPSSFLFLLLLPLVLLTHLDHQSLPVHGGRTEVHHQEEQQAIEETLPALLTNVVAVHIAGFPQ